MSDEEIKSLAERMYRICIAENKSQEDKLKELNAFQLTPELALRVIEYLSVVHFIKEDNGDNK